MDTTCRFCSWNPITSFATEKKTKTTTTAAVNVAAKLRPTLAKVSKSKMVAVKCMFAAASLSLQQRTCTLRNTLKLQLGNCDSASN